VTALGVNRRAVAARLAAAGCVAPEDEADQLVGGAPDAAVLDQWLERRERGEPLAWITGTTRFCGHAVRVERGVFVPRWQSEELATRAAALVPRGGRAVDLCTGAGAIAVHVSRSNPGATVVAVDIDERAVRCARRNGVAAVVGDLGTALRDRVFDVVTAVAPYVPRDELRLLPPDVRRHEPPLALDGGPDGLETVRRAVGTAALLLRTGGWFLTEIGGSQLDALRPVLEAQGFADVSPWSDDDGDLRGVAATLRATTRC
jgi:release factor glutamine methyltransferase